MSVVVYRNILNKEFKTFARLGKVIVQDLVNDGIHVEMVYDARIKCCYDQLIGNETIIIITHGSDDTLYHKYDHSSSKRHQPLISTDLIRNGNPQVSEILKNNKIIAISCRTARELGPLACEQGGSKVYLGFNTRIHFDMIDRKKLNYLRSRDYDELLMKIYKTSFIFALEQAIKNQWTFSKLKTVLSRELNKNVMAVNNLVGNPYWNHILLSQAFLAVSNVAQNIFVFGDSSETVS